MKITIIIWLLMIVTGFSGTTIKFATLATENSTWLNVMNEFAAEVEQKTGGEVNFKIYPGGVSGDEKDVIRKIRIGQLHSAGFTGVGLGAILPEVRIMDSPFLFRNYDEIDHVSEKLFDTFAQKFEENGYILLGWAEVGFVYVFTNSAVNSIKDMSGVKMWMWEGDPVAEASFKAMGISPIPLSITDVLTSLQTNLIDGVYVAPLACLALQWQTKVKYMLDLPLAISNGAVLVSKKQFSRLSPEHQQVLRELGLKHFRKLTLQSRTDNQKSLQVIKDGGIVNTKISNQSKINSFWEAGAKARRDLVGKLYDQKFLDQVESLLKEYRAAKK